MGKHSSPIRKFIDNKKLSGGLCPPLEKKEMLRVSPLEPTKNPVPRPCKPLKKLEQNFAASRRSQVAKSVLRCKTSTLIRQVNCHGLRNYQ